MEEVAGAEGGDNKEERGPPERGPLTLEVLLGLKIEPRASPYLGAANSKAEAMRCNFIVELGSSSEF